MRSNDLHFIIFSMNRACQLDAFLKSMCTMFPEYSCIHITILYKVTSNDYEKGYDIVKLEYNSNIEFYRETILRNDLDLLVGKYNEKYVAFFCDDDIWKYPFSLNFKEFDEFDKNNNIVTFSLRMSPLIRKCHPMGNIDTPPPKFENSLYIWNWTNSSMTGDWNYPMSVDGHIFKTELIKYYIKTTAFRNVTEFEGYIAAKPPRHLPLMICCKDSPIFNIPMNIASEISSNINMNVTKEYLNERFLKGDRIDTGFYIGFKNISPHQEVEVKWK